jgi:serine/threonine protein kinase/Flp pilus assembly protein TadD
MSSRVDEMPVRFPAAEADSLAVGVDFAALRGAKRELVEQLCARRAAGESVRPEDFLPQWPVEPKRDADVAGLLFADFQSRQSSGENPSIVEYERRFPEHQDSLAALFRQHAVLRSLRGTHGSSTTTLALPSVGDELFGFRLCRELGRGAFARAFLAEQCNLAGRPVVLKVSAADGNEPQTLAQLQHTNIVPIYSVHEDAAAGLRAVCMPYFGGASLSSVLRAVYAEGEAVTRGEQLVRALAVVRAPWSFAPNQGKAEGSQIFKTGQGTLPQLEKLDYVHAVVWIVARLAEALEHAHQRGVLHRDVKPSNVLLSADGQPMLLDFNLAQNIASGQAQAEATLGGTVAYMSPEHLLAIARREPELIRKVGRPADIYSLGMVLYEMLVGHGPFEQSVGSAPVLALIEAMAEERTRGIPSLRARASKESRNPEVPWSLESIIRKCLAPDQADRYQEAGRLAEDLRRFLDDRPLRYAPELSRTEQLRKWLRRHPRVTSSGSVATAACVLILTIGLVLTAVHRHLVDARDELAGIQAQECRQQYIDGSERALCLVNTTSDLHDHLLEGRKVCERTLSLYGVLERADWQDDPDWQRLAESDRRRLLEDTRELLLLLAWARARSGSDPEDAARNSLALLNKAEALTDLQPSPALWLDRASYLEQLGDKVGAEAAQETARSIPPAGARDHYLLATAHARGRKYDAAIAELDQALRLNGRHYWSWFQHGICHLELGKLASAASDFGVCIGLWPEFSWGHFNLGYTLYRGGNRVEAIEHYSAALRCDPDFLDAMFNRGLAFKELERFPEALADFDKAIELGRSDQLLQAERALVLEKLGRFDEADAAFAEVLPRVDQLPAEARDGIRLTYGFAVADRFPDKARTAFVEVIREKDATPQVRSQAYYGEAMLAAPTRPREAIAALTKAVDADADLAEARRFRGILWARVGDFEAAGNDIRWCLDRDKTSGGHLYAAACITALAAKKTNTAGKANLVTAAVKLLRDAFALGYGKDQAANDPDLSALHGQAEFERLLSEQVIGKTGKVSVDKRQKQR